MKGGPATYGSGGKERVDTECGVVFTFTNSESPGSDNGTSTSSGQIPGILFRQKKSSPFAVATGAPAAGPFAGSAFTNVLDFVTVITRTAADILNGALSSGRGADFIQHVLTQSSFLSVLLPSVIAEVAVAVVSPAAAKAVLDVVRPLLTQISGIIRALGIEGTATQGPVYQSVVESPHPYNEKNAVHMPYVVEFPETVTHMVVEFAPECATSQEEDYVQVLTPNTTTGAAPVAVTPRYLGCALDKKVERVVDGTWPRGPVLAAGRSLCLDFQTATEYVAVEGASHYGFACTVTGYTSQDLALPSLCRLERELTFLGGVCAQVLLDSSQPAALPPLVDKKGKKNEDAEKKLAATKAVDEKLAHHILRRGLDTSESAPPARLFLADFIAATPATPAALLVAKLGEKLVVRNDAATRKAYAAVLLHNGLVEEAASCATYLQRQAEGMDAPPPHTLALLEKTYGDLAKALNLWTRDRDPEEERRKAEEEAAAKRKAEEEAAEKKKKQEEDEVAAALEAVKKAEEAAQAAAAPAAPAAPPAAPAAPPAAPPAADVPAVVVETPAEGASEVSTKPPEPAPTPLSVTIPPPPAPAPAMMDTKWACDACTFMNDLDRVKCEICGSAMPGASGVELAGIGKAPPDGKWFCNMCTFLNNLGTDECEMCQTKRPKQGTAETATVVVEPAVAEPPPSPPPTADSGFDMMNLFDTPKPNAGRGRLFPKQPAVKEVASGDEEADRVDAAATLLLELQPAGGGPALNRFARLKSTMNHMARSLLDPDIMTPRASAARQSRAFSDDDIDLRRAFNTFDTDGDGSITPAELRAVVTRLMPEQTLTDEQLDELVRQADTDGNGRIDFAEFTASHMQTLLDSNAFQPVLAELPSEKLKCLGDSADYKWMVEFMTSKDTEPSALRSALTVHTERAALRTSGYAALRALLEIVALAPSRCDLVWFLAATMAAAGHHFTRNVEAAGAKSIDELRDSVYALYNTLAAMLKDTLEGMAPGDAVPTQRAILQAWNVAWERADHMFLQNSGVFTILDAVNANSGRTQVLLSLKGKEPAGLLMGIPARSDGGAEPNVVTPYLLTDITRDAKFEVSSNAEMIASLTDNVSDSFWQSSDGDGTRQFTISLKEPGPVAQVSVCVDFTSDDYFMCAWFTVAAGASVDELKPAGRTELSATFVGWATQTVASDAGVVRLAIGPRNQAVRVRQVRVFGGRSAAPLAPAVVASRLPNVSLEAMRVFHALANQVFGGLQGTDSAAADTNGDDSANLREAVVGLLSPRMDEFAKAGLSTLQGGVVNLLVSGFVRLADGRCHLPWDKIVASYGYAEVPKDDPAGTGFYKDDEALFELTQMLLALSAAETGQRCIAESAPLLVALFTLIRQGTSRVQRAALDILRRVLPATTPASLSGCLGTEPAKGPAEPVEALLLSIAKSLSVVVRVKGGEKAQRSDIRMEESPGRVNPELASQIGALVFDVLRQAPGWEMHVKQKLQDSIVGLATLQKLTTETLLLKRELWLAIAAMAVVGKNKEFLDAVRAAAEARSALLTARGEVEGKRPCANCEDGTASNRRCWHCDMDLCAECDRVLHKPKQMREHRRTNVVDETEFRVAASESSVRADLSALQIALDVDRSKAIVALKQSDATLTACRCCHAALTDKNMSPLDGVCSEAACQEKASTGCTRAHNCGHACGGVRGEDTCLPCLKGCDATEPLPQKADDPCMVCFTDELGEAPCIQLACSHIFHYACIRAMLQAKWSGSRIVFGFMDCPVCKREITHPLLADLLEPLRALKTAVLTKSLARAKFMGLDKAEEVLTIGAQYHDDLQGFAMHKLCYYLCSKCKQPYFGGEYRCAEVAPAVEEELVCDGCSEVVAASICPRHGADYLEFKCRFCCTPAIWFCFGTTHFCEPCHNDHSRLCGMSAASLNPCPAKGRNEAMSPGTPCPLGIKHPPQGTEFALGCGLCKKEGLKGVKF